MEIEILSVNTCGKCIHWHKLQGEEFRKSDGCHLGDCELYFGHYFEDDNIDADQKCFESVNVELEE